LNADPSLAIENLTREKVHLEDKLRELQQLFTSSNTSSSGGQNDRPMETLLTSWNESKLVIAQLQIEISYLQQRISILQEEYRDIRSLDELKADWNEYEKEMESLFNQTRKQLEKEKILIKSEKEKILAERTHLDEKVRLPSSVRRSSSPLPPVGDRSRDLELCWPSWMREKANFDSTNRS
jgi:chromosome segregation ATPase